MTLNKTTRLKQQNQNVYSYLCVSSYLNQGLIYYMKTKMHFKKKTKKIQLHEITKGQNKREKGKNGERYTKWKILTLLEMDTDLDTTIAPKKGLIDPANRIWILQIQQNHLTNNCATSLVILSGKWFL